MASRLNFLLVARELWPSIKTYRDFLEHFGTSHNTVSKLWDRVEPIAADGAMPKHLLWTFYWWKVYAVQGVCAAFCGCDTKTFIYWRTHMLVAIASIDNINFRDRFDRAHRPMLAYISVDGTDCPIQEPSPWSPMWYSHKINAAGLRYEIGVCIQTGKIVWVNGPYPCGVWPDLRIFRHRLMHALALHEWVVADNGYRDGFQFVIPKDCGPQWFQKMTGTATARHETINSRFKRFKRFKVLSTPFRHGVDKHELVFAAIACVVQLSLDEDPPFQVDYDDSDIDRLDLI